jgi:hypothetical protein
VSWRRQGRGQRAVRAAFSAGVGRRIKKFSFIVKVCNLNAHQLTRKSKVKSQKSKKTASNVHLMAKPAEIASKKPCPHGQLGQGSFLKKADETRAEVNSYLKNQLFALRTWDGTVDLEKSD